MSSPLLRPTLYLLSLGLLLIAPDAIAQPDDHCDKNWPDGEEIAELSDPTIDESSGLGDSWIHDDRLWTHNDSGDQPRLWALDKQGQVHTTLHVEGADNIDWEDMAIAPCSDAGPPCIYVGDIGDNLSQREDVQIYRFPEPDLGDEPPTDMTIAADDVETLTYRYDTGPRDAEAILVHPETREMWVIEKTGDEAVEVFPVDEDFDADEPQVVTASATLIIDAPHELLRMVTAADISPDGQEFTLRTYGELFRYCADDPDDFASAFQATPSTNVVSPPTVQGEALTYDRGDGALWLTSEQLPAPLIRVPPISSETEEIPDQEPPSDDDPPEDDPPPEEQSPVEDPSFSSSCSTTTPGAPIAPLLLIALFAVARRGYCPESRPSLTP